MVGIVLLETFLGTFAHGYQGRGVGRYTKTTRIRNRYPSCGSLLPANQISNLVQADCSSGICTLTFGWLAKLSTSTYLSI